MIVIMIYVLYKADLPRRIERKNQGIPRYYNVPPVTEIGGNIYYVAIDN